MAGTRRFLSRWRKTAWILALAGAGGLGVFWSLHDHGSSTSDQPAVLENFTLQDHKGKVFSLAQGPRPFALVYFGYTFCPDICPMALTHMTQALQALPPEQAALIQPLFVTVDPARDTRDALARYAGLFDSRILFLREEPEKLAPVLKAWGVFAEQAPEDSSAAGYLVDHSSMVYWVKRDGTLLARFSHDTPPSLWVQTLQPVLSGTPAP
jgi:cytochrome oxidase Cu insertion factor (SCO1/SenC/PrrC family)